jgi:hypothetical protein
MENIPPTMLIDISKQLFRRDLDRLRDEKVRR